MLKRILFIISLFFIVFVSFSQTKSEIANYTKNYNKVKLDKMAKEAMIKQKAERDEALVLAEQNGWSINFVDDNGVVHSLMKLSEDKSPVYYITHNRNAGRSTRAKWLHDSGGMGLNVEGQGMIGHVWDGGHALLNHQEFTHSGTEATRIHVMDEEGEYDFEGENHATHVTGTIGAYGAYASTKGMAPQIQIDSYDWFNDKPEVIEAASNGMLVSNHSYGGDINDVPDWKLGAYTMDARGWDLIMNEAPYYLMVVSAGNDGNNNSANGEPLEGNAYYDKLYDQSVSKNVMVVGAANDLSVNSQGEVVGSITIASFSSEGPTDDLRIKPDITGNGVGVYSPIFQSTSSYDSYDGTSMASPNVAGSLLLLQQLNNETNGEYLLSSSLRGLALHNADDGGIEGPDAKYGWGYLNTKKAAECIINDGGTAEIEVFTLENGQTYSFVATADGVNDFKASISWNDPASNNVAYSPSHVNRPDPVLTNDLDIRITKDGTTYFPWKLTSVSSNAKVDNNVDVFERIDIEDASGDYNVTISHKGILENPQEFTLILTGITASSVGITSNEFKVFNVWPNPNSGLFKIYVEDVENLNVSITDILGKKIFENNYTNTSKYFEKDFDLSYLPEGVYMVSVISENRKSTNKIIIEK